MTVASPFDYDLFVIGGGSGGVRAARVAAGHGARVGIAEEYRFGGTCVIRGCVPKKLLVYASRFADEFADAGGYGWSVGDVRFDWPQLIAAKDREIARLEAVYRDGLRRAGVTIYPTRAVLSDPHTVRLSADGREIKAATILVATGASPVLDRRVMGIEHAITSNEMFHLPALPSRLAIVGGGYIAVEFACLMQALGTRVTLIYRGAPILRGFDGELREALQQAISARGVQVLTQRSVIAIERDGEQRRCRLDDGEPIIADQVLYAIGRRPNTAGLGLDTAGVRLRDDGAIAVDAYSRTSVESIYAVGDVTDRVALTPAAIREGQAFADSVFGDRPTPVEHRLIPTAVFSTPELATVGLSEDQARERGLTIDVYRSRFTPLKNTLSGRRERALIKLVVARDSSQVLGVHLLGPDAAELIQVLAIPLGMGASKRDFDSALAVHPTLAEELVTLRVAG